MAYMQPTGSEPLTASAVETLARIAGLTLPAEDLATLAQALAHQLASIALLDQLDLAEISPVLEFDPRWPEVGKNR